LKASERILSKVKETLLRELPSTNLGCSKNTNPLTQGQKSDKGNRLTRFEDLNGQLHLRITTGHRELSMQRC
jgi:hypothetical protein